MTSNIFMYNFVSALSHHGENVYLPVYHIYTGVTGSRIRNKSNDFPYIHLETEIS